MSTRPILIVTFLAAASSAFADVQQVDPATLTTADLDGFEEFEGGPDLPPRFVPVPMLVRRRLTGAAGTCGAERSGAEHVSAAMMIASGAGDR